MLLMLSKRTLNKSETPLSFVFKNDVPQAKKNCVVKPFYFADSLKIVMQTNYQLYMNSRNCWHKIVVMEFITHGGWGT